MIQEQTRRILRSLKTANYPFSTAEGRHFFSDPVILFCIYLLSVLVGTSAAQDLRIIDIKKLTLDELININVTSVSKTEEKLQSAAAAVFVLTREEIQGAGVTSIPDALRLVPGVEVAQIDASKWAVSIRGFNSRTANKLLVLVDGRSVYDPLFTGVLWEVKDVMLEDVDHIEVIRGPGGTLWGANAVNGVINIITRKARDSQGPLVAFGGGTEEQGFANLRYGWQIAQNTFVRVYGKAFERDTGFSPQAAHDGWKMGRAGFRLDSELDDENSVTVQGDLYDAQVGEAVNPTGWQDVDHFGGNLLFRWKRAFTQGSEMVLQTYYDFTDLHNLALGEKRHTADLDFHHSIKRGERHEIVWGLGYRHTRDDIRNGPDLILDPAARSDNLFSVFGQDKINLINGKLHLIVGSKFEDNDYSGLEIQPNARIAWTPNLRNTLWASVSRAVRTPSRLESDLVFNGVNLGTNFDSEVLVAHELGYRVHPTENLLFDVTGFVNLYHRLLTTEVDSSGNFSFENNMDGHAYGIEWAGKWQASSWLRLSANYTFLRMNLQVVPSSAAGASAGTMERRAPEHQVSFYSALSPFTNVQFHAALRFVDKLRSLNVPSYLVADLRLAWRPAEKLELALVALNLLDDHHPEQISSTSTEVEASVYGKITFGL